MVRIFIEEVVAGLGNPFRPWTNGSEFDPSGISGIPRENDILLRIPLGCFYVLRVASGTAQTNLKDKCILASMMTREMVPTCNGIRSWRRWPTLLPLGSATVGWSRQRHSFIFRCSSWSVRLFCTANQRIKTMKWCSQLHELITPLDGKAQPERISKTILSKIHVTPKYGPTWSVIIPPSPSTCRDCHGASKDGYRWSTAPKDNVRPPGQPNYRALFRPG